MTKKKFFFTSGTPTVKFLGVKLLSSLMGLNSALILVESFGSGPDIKSKRIN